MPDQSGKLTEEEKAQVLAWVAEKGKAGNPNCPVCGSPNWLLADHLVQPITLGANRSLLLGGIGYPQVMLVSTVCGYTRFLNAVVLGLIPPTAPEEKKG
jgi:ribosomal protein S27AE